MKPHNKILFAPVIILTCYSNANASHAIEKIGDFLSFKVLPVYSAATTFYNSDWDTWYDYDWQGLKQLVVVNLIKSTITDKLKDSVDETRPNGLGNNSFPSGHTSNAFAQAAFIHRRYGINQAIIPYTLATFVGYSRVQSKWHYTHDVLAGAAIGFLSAWIFSDKKQDIMLSVDSDGARIDFHTTF